MGCCKSHFREEFNQDKLGSKLKSLIDSQSTKRVKAFLDLSSSTKNKDLINTPIIFYSKHLLTPLAYSALKGNDRIFSFLLSLGAQIEKTEKSLESQGLRMINILCSCSSLKVLKVYLPLYLSQSKDIQTLSKTNTLELSSGPSTPLLYELPIHSACRLGNFEVVHFFHSFFSEVENVPKEFDVHALSDYYEENSAFVACRAGCFPLVKYLNEKCKVDFKKLNKCRESTLLACVAASSKKNDDFCYLECISYLIEIVKVDLSYMFEEILYLAENEMIVRYLEGQLEKIGILVKKKDIDQSCFKSFDVRFESRTISGDNNFCVEASKENSAISSILSCGTFSPSWVEGLDPLLN